MIDATTQQNKAPKGKSTVTFHFKCQFHLY
jgi:hypothetical protein